MTQKGIRVTVLMSEREKGMLDSIRAKTGENMSQVINALIMQEYYRLQTGAPLISCSSVEILEKHK